MRRRQSLFGRPLVLRAGVEPVLNPVEEREVASACSARLDRRRLGDSGNTGTDERPVSDQRAWNTELADDTSPSLGADTAGPHIDPDESIDRLIDAARAASPMDRVTYRDPIVSYGTEGLPALIQMANDGLGAFAVRTITKVGETSAKYEAAEALRQIDRSRVSAAVSNDIDEALARLAPREAARKSRPSAGATPVAGQLIRGDLYRRVELHEAGLGGNRQMGISHPADGAHVLLFSGGSGRRDYGVRDPRAVSGAPNRDSSRLRRATRLTVRPTCRQCRSTARTVEWTARTPPCIDSSPGPVHIEADGRWPGVVASPRSEPGYTSPVPVAFACL